jgi:zinc protease
MSARALTWGLLLLAWGAHATPLIQQWETPNGARVLFVQAGELPIVDLQVVFDAGGARDAHQPGLARLTNSLLSEGAAGLSADQIAEGFARQGAQFGGASLRDMAVYSLRSLSDPAKLDPAMDLLANVLARPDFPADALERLRRQMLVGLRMEGQSPGTLAERTFYAALYGGHPYAQPPQGNEATVQALSVADVRGHYSRYYVGRNAVVAIVGDLQRSQAEQLAARAVGSLPAGAPASALPAPDGPAGPQQRVVEHPSTQTHVLLGLIGISRLDPDFFALYVGNHALGGNALVSLLGQEVREKRGLSYSVHSELIPMRVPGPFLITLQTKNDQAQEALQVARQTLRRFVEQGPTAEELAQAKQNLTGGFPLRIDSNRKIADYLASIGFYRLPSDYLDTFVARVEAVTLDHVRDAFRRRVDPERLLTVLVGEGLAAPASSP